jgi:chitin disaccharide deacetylase
MRRATLLTVVIGALIVTNLSAAHSQNTTKTLQERLGYSPNAKLLIVHADDLGMARSVNAATIKGFESGLVTSGSIMIPCPWVPDIAAYARQHPEADLGLHLTLTSEWTTFRWGPVMSKNQVASLLDENGYLRLTESEAAAKANPKDVEAEIRAQIDRARALGINPSHLDSHMGTLYQNKELFGILLKVAREHKLPSRVSKEWFGSMTFLPSVLEPQDVVIDRIITIDPSVTPDNWASFYTDAVKTMQPGVSEFVIHLAYDDEEMRGATSDHPNWGAAWRQRDFQYFTSDAFRKLLQENQIKLITWREVGQKLYGTK